MENDHPKVNIGLVDFADPTLLILSGASGFQWLAQLMESRLDGDLLKLSSGIELTCNMRLHLKFSDDAAGLQRHGSDLLWNVSPSDAGVFADKLRHLADAGAPGHQYLDPTAGIQRIEVIASKGEYNPEQVFSELPPVEGEGDRR